MARADLLDQAKNTVAKTLLFSDLNCPFCFAMHERVSELALHEEVSWCLIEHAPAFNSELLTEEQAALLKFEVELVQKRAQEIAIQQPAFCVNTRLAILTYIHVQALDSVKGNKLLEMLYCAYWQQGLDISDQQVIHELLLTLDLNSFDITENDQQQLNQWQKKWQYGDFDRRIPAMQSPDQQLMLGLQHKESIKQFIHDNDILYIEQGQTCLHHGEYHIGFITSVAFVEAIKNQQAGFICHQYTSVNALLEDHLIENFDAIILCYSADQKSNFSYIRCLKNKVQLNGKIPILYITDIYKSSDEVQAFTLGANDYIRLDSGLPAVCARINKELIHSRSLQVLHQHASVDGLTGIINKREFQRNLNKEWRIACRNQLDLSIIMIDIDYFKNYNDHFGHCAGDEVLRNVSKTLGLNLYRAKDILARFGGEEFVILLPETNSSGLEFVCQQLRYNVENQRIEHPESHVSEHVTISIGGCYARPHADQSALQFIELADTALYQAKEHGRNQFVILTMDAVNYD